MENDDIENWQIKASRGNINRTGRLNKSVWYSDTRQWLQIDLKSHHTIITRVATQGGKRHNPEENDAGWVTKYKLQYGDDGEHFQYYKNHTTTEEKVKLN